jgi:hypothetical protein
MHDFIPKLSLKRRRLMPRRPHPDLEFLLRRQWDQLGLGLEKSDDGFGLDGQDCASQVLPWIGSEVVPLSPQKSGRIPAGQAAIAPMVGFLSR